MEAAYRKYLQAGEEAGGRYELAPPRKVPLGVAGGELGKRAGSSLEFMDHREYQPGDDIRWVDWNAYARSDKLVVKLYREEVNPHVDLLIDGSRSMALENSEKPGAALALAALFATAAENAEYSHCAWLAADGCRELVNGRDRPSTWDGIELSFRESVAESVRRAPPRWRTRAVRVLISDLLWLGDPTELLLHLAENASGVVVVQVLARDDVEPPERGNLRLVDSETGEIREVFVDAVAEQRYRDALARHQENWRRACLQIGATMVTVLAEDVMARWDLEPLVASDILRIV